MKLRVRFPGSPAVEDIILDDDAPWAQLVMVLAQRSNIPPIALKILGGFPPKPLQPDEDVCMVSSVVREGDLLTVQQGTALVRQGTTDGKYVPPAEHGTVFVRRTVPGDNSCLFHACAYILKDKSRSGGPALRQECAEVVLSNPEKFNAALLGQPTTAYAQWILRPTSWGGAIELLILSFLYQTEIIALDLESGIMQRFGEMENYAVRGFVVYTGNHYDAIAMADATAMGSEQRDRVLFNARDERVFQRAVQFVREECSKKPSR